MKKIWIVTLFPDYFKPFLEMGVISKSKDKFDFKIVDLRKFSLNKYGSVDDSPYGGGAGMLIRADVLKLAVESIWSNGQDSDFDIGVFKRKFHVIYTSPRGSVWNSFQSKAMTQKLTSEKETIFICGRYEGIDERFIENYVDEIFSIGDFVLSGGELAVMSILDSSLRFVDEILGNEMSAKNDSFENGLLEYPQYTRPREFEGKGVPEVLLSGDHAKIDKYRNDSQVMMTEKYRPDLIAKKK